MTVPFVSLFVPLFFLFLSCMCSHALSLPNCSAVNVYGYKIYLYTPPLLFPLNHQTIQVYDSLPPCILAILSYLSPFLLLLSKGRGSHTMPYHASPRLASPSLGFEETRTKVEGIENHPHHRKSSSDSTSLSSLWACCKYCV